MLDSTACTEPSRNQNCSCSTLIQTLLTLLKKVYLSLSLRQMFVVCKCYKLLTVHIQAFSFVTTYKTHSELVWCCNWCFIQIKCFPVSVGQKIYLLHMFVSFEWTQSFSLASFYSSCGIVHVFQGLLNTYMCPSETCVYQYCLNDSDEDQK